MSFVTLAFAFAFAIGCEGEGAGGPTGTFGASDHDGDGYAEDDCDDDDVEIHPGASERCDDADTDEDCDGDADDEDSDAQGKITIYTDADGDGYGVEPEGEACDAGEGFATHDGDCDDDDAAVHPGGVEVCDDLDIDEDCDGDADDADGDASGDFPIYEDADGDGYGVAPAHAAVCDLPSGFSTESGDCDDDNPEVNPDAAEVCDDGLDNNCDGSPNGCGLTDTIELSSSTAHAKITGVSEEDLLSVSMCPLGDMDADGNDDFMIGAPESHPFGKSHPHGGPGAAYVFHGPVSGALDADAAATTIEGSVASLDGALGFSCAGPADLDDDGTSDLVVGAPYWGSHDGAVAIWFGSIASSEGAADLVLYGKGSSLAGNALAVGDADGDGADDVVVAGSGDGTVWYFEGPLSGGTMSVSSATATLEYSYTTFHEKALGLTDTDVGDYDADGLDDIVVGIPWYDATGFGSTAGTLFVVRGAPSGAVSLDTDSDMRLSGSDDGQRFGQSVALGGDANGDGYDDLLVGVPGLDWGAAFLFHGPILFDATVITRTGESLDSFGGTVAYVGDLSPDGRDDIAIGQVADVVGATHAGSVRLFYGPLAEGASYTSDDADIALVGESEFDQAGSSIASAGDQNGDGYVDLLVGVPEDDEGGEDAGAAYLFLGGGGGI